MSPPADPTRLAIFDALAALLAYPDSRHLDVVHDAVASLAAYDPSLDDVLAPLSDLADTKTSEQIEEIYTRTFDIAPDCALEIGWHVYGENYSRGAFLVEMRDRMRSLGLVEDSELPDHVTHVLAVLGRSTLSDAVTLARGQLLPALRKMRRSLTRAAPYACVLEAIEIVTRECFSIADDPTIGEEASPYPEEKAEPPPDCSSQCGRLP